MKLRFSNNSLRVRVNRREVEGLASGATLEEEILFPGDARISYVVEPSSSASPEVWFREGVIRISAPRAQVSDWAQSDSIGIYFERPASGTFLKIAIEKDLECIDSATGEYDPDAFPRAPGKNC